MRGRSSTPSGDPYGNAHQRRRRAVIRPGAVCEWCGEPASELDHLPPLAVHHHIEGSGCCRYVPSCGPCQRKQAAELGWQGTHDTPPQPVLEDLPDALPCAEPDDPLWDRAPWLEPFRQVPDEARWPRYMTGPHPAAVGSYGAGAVEWLELEAGIRLRWWQALALTRILEHDGSGLLVWLDVLASTARQSGKSTLLRALSTWRLHQADLFGEEQTILHTAKDLPVCKEVQLPAMAWAELRGYSTRRQNGAEQITEPRSQSRWIIRGKGSIYGYASSLVLCDEAWGIQPEVVDDGLEPTLAERVSPQLMLASTAHRRATILFPTRRAAAFDSLEQPDSTLMIEWSVPRSVDIDDRDLWREASPHWSDGRARLLEARLRKVHAGESLDPDEDDPHESFLAQYLNVWPVRLGPDAGARLLPDGLWAERFELIDADGPVTVAVEDNYGRGAAVAACARVTDSVFELDGWTCDTWEIALDQADRLIASRPGSRLIVGNSIAARIPMRKPARAGSAETRTGLALFRDLARNRQIVHSVTPELDEQIDGIRVRDLPTGGLALISSRRADVVRAAVWALALAQHRTRIPAVH